MPAVLTCARSVASTPKRVNRGPRVRAALARQDWPSRGAPATRLGPARGRSRCWRPSNLSLFSTARHRARLLVAGEAGSHRHLRGGTKTEAVESTSFAPCGSRGSSLVPYKTLTET